jgi:hypothetical protein
VKKHQFRLANLRFTAESEMRGRLWLTGPRSSSSPALRS